MRQISSSEILSKTNFIARKHYCGFPLATPTCPSILPCCRPVRLAAGAAAGRHRERRPPGDRHQHPAGGRRATPHPPSAPIGHSPRRFGANTPLRSQNADSRNSPEGFLLMILIFFQGHDFDGLRGLKGHYNEGEAKSEFVWHDVLVVFFTVIFVYQ